jgi:hypothetical protein
MYIPTVGRYLVVVSFFASVVILMNPDLKQTVVECVNPLCSYSGQTTIHS